MEVGQPPSMGSLKDIQQSCQWLVFLQKDDSELEHIIQWRVLHQVGRAHEAGPLLHKAKGSLGLEHGRHWHGFRLGRVEMFGL